MFFSAIMPTGYWHCVAPVSSVMVRFAALPTKPPAATDWCASRGRRSLVVLTMPASATSLFPVRQPRLTLDKPQRKKKKNKQTRKTHTHGERERSDDDSCLKILFTVAASAKLRSFPHFHLLQGEGNARYRRRRVGATRSACKCSTPPPDGKYWFQDGDDQTLGSTSSPS